MRAPKTPGVLRFGTYEPGEVYEVPEAEAARLIAAKGFEEVRSGAGRPAPSDVKE